MPKSERIIIYCTKDTKKRWVSLAIDLEMNYEELLNALMDLYEAMSNYMNDKDIKRITNAFKKKVELRYA